MNDFMHIHKCLQQGGQKQRLAGREIVAFPLKRFDKPVLLSPRLKYGGKFPGEKIVFHQENISCIEKNIYIL